MSINLDSARAARRESGKEAPTVVFGKKTYTLPVELPFPVVQQFTAMAGDRLKGDAVAVNAALESIFRNLFGQKQYEQFMAAGPSLDDLTELLQGLAAEYGVTQGESSASEDS